MILDLKEHDWSPELKIVVNLFVGGTEHLYGFLIERIIEAFAYT